MTISSTLPARIRNIGLSGTLNSLSRAMRSHVAWINRPARQDRASLHDPWSSRDVADRLAIRAGVRAGNW